MTDDFQMINNSEIDISNLIDEAVQLCEKEYTHEEILSVMRTENDVEKQICILKLSELKTQEEADLLVFQLTGHHGLIREASAIKISEFILEKNYGKYFLKESALVSILKAVNDINPNICRLICSALPKLFCDAEQEKSKFLDLLYSRFEEIFDELEKLKRSNWYTKKLFNLYWGLEALAVLEPYADERLESVLLQAAAIRDYTIREKAAYVLSLLKTTTPVIDEIKNKLKQDDNFYVKRYAEKFSD